MARRRNELERLYGNGKGLPSAVEDDRARLMPETSINPEVGSKLIDLSVLDATRAFGKKIWRVVKLRELSAYNLPTKTEDKDPLKTARLTRELQEQEAEARRSLRTMKDLETSLRDLPERIRALKLEHATNKERIGGLQKSLSRLQSSVASLRAYVKDFEKSEKIAGWEAEVESQTGWRQTLGLAKVVAARALYNDPSDEKFRKAHEAQAEVEEDIRKLEIAIKAEKGVDLATSPVEDNLNAQTAYDPNALSLGQFQARQQRLLDRLKACVEVPGDFDTGKTPLQNEKKELSRQRKKRKAADKAVRKFEAGRRYKLERLLWHEFGDQIALIRGWQARLPKMSHLGPDAYMSHVTAINRDYESLRAEIAAFEAANSISGLVEMLDYELGIRRPLRLSPVPPMPPAAEEAPLEDPAEEPAEEPAPEEPEPAAEEAPLEEPAEEPAPEELEPAAEEAPLEEPAEEPAPEEPEPSARPNPPPLALPAQLSPERQELMRCVHDYLSYEDVYDQLSDTEKERLDKARAMREQGKVKEMYEKYGSELLRLMKDQNKRTYLNNLANNLWQKTHDFLNKLGVGPDEISPWTRSKSWVYLDLAKQSYLLAHPEESNSNYRLADPLEDTPIRGEIVARMLGWEIRQLFNYSSKRDLFEMMIERSNEQESRFVKEFLTRSQTAPKHSWEYTRVGYFFIRIVSQADNALRTAPSPQPPPAPPVAPPSSPTPVIEVKAEVIELPLSDEQAKNTPLDEQKKIVQKNLTRIFGLDSTQSTIVWNILGDLETTRPDKFAKYIGLICLFSDALEFLFRLRYQDQPLQIPDKKLKALPAKPKDRQSMHGSKILDVLDSPNRLQVLAATLRSGKLQEVISGLTAVGEIYNWFKTLK